MELEEAERQVALWVMLDPGFMELDPHKGLKVGKSFAALILTLLFWNVLMSPLLYRNATLEPFDVSNSWSRPKAFTLVRLKWILKIYGVKVASLKFIRVRNILCQNLEKQNLDETIINQHEGLQHCESCWSIFSLQTLVLFAQLRPVKVLKNKNMCHRIRKFQQHVRSKCSSILASNEYGAR